MKTTFVNLSLKFNENNPVDKKDEENCRSWLKLSNLPARLDTIANLSCILDTIKNILTSISSGVTDFLARQIILFITGIFNILFSLIPFFFCNCCHKEKEDTFPINDEKKSELLFSSLKIKILNNEEKQKIADIENLQKKLLIERKENTKSKYKCWNNYINFTYLFVRNINGILNLVKAFKMNTGESCSNIDQVSKWIDIVSNLAYLTYMFANLLPSKCSRCCNSKNLEITSKSQTIFYHNSDKVLSPNNQLPLLTNSMQQVP